MNNEYETLDIKGREIVKKIFYKANFTDGTMTDYFDLETNTMNGRSLIEVKYREKINSTEYDTDILEYSKLSNLRNEDSEANYFYMMLFKDNVARLYNLNNISITDVYLDVKECPASSVESARGVKDKLMIELKKETAKIYKWKD